MMADVNAARSWWTYKYNRLLQETGNRLGLPMGKATEVWLKVTHRCATRCVMCNIWQMSNHPSEELSTNEWKTVLDDLRSWLGPFKVTFTGGDPFTRRDIVELLSYAASIGLLPEVITRGVGVRDQAMAQRIVASGLIRYHVSIESLRPEIHDHLIPPKGSLERAVKGLRWLSDERQKQKSPIGIVIKTIIMGYNRDEILPIVDWVSESGFDEVKFQPIEQTLWEEEDPTWYKGSELWPENQKAVDSCVEVVEELIRRKRAGAPIHNPEQEFVSMIRYFQDPEGMYRVVKDHILATAGAPQQLNYGTVEIWHDGEVKTSRRRPPLGNLKEKRIREIWATRSDQITA